MSPPLRTEADHFLDCIRNGRTAMTGLADRRDGILDQAPGNATAMPVRSHEEVFELGAVIAVHHGHEPDDLAERDRHARPTRCNAVPGEDEVLRSSQQRRCVAGVGQRRLAKHAPQCLQVRRGGRADRQPWLAALVHPPSRAPRTLVSQRN